jgi:hypothetical protein
MTLNKLALKKLIKIRLMNKKMQRIINYLIMTLNLVLDKDFSNKEVPKSMTYQIQEVWQKKFQEY